MIKSLEDNWSHLLLDPLSFLEFNPMELRQLFQGLGFWNMLMFDVWATLPYCETLPLKSHLESFCTKCYLQRGEFCPFVHLIDYWKSPYGFLCLPSVCCLVTLLVHSTFEACTNTLHMSCHYGSPEYVTLFYTNFNSTIRLLKNWVYHSYSLPNILQTESLFLVHERLFTTVLIAYILTLEYVSQTQSVNQSHWSHY